METVLYSARGPGVMPHQASNTIRRIGPLGTIVLLHILVFYGLLHGRTNSLPAQTSQSFPKEVIATFITPQPPRPEPPAVEPPRPAPPRHVPTPKATPALKKPVAKPKPAAPAINPQPSERAITAPTEPAAPSVAKPSAELAAAPALPEPKPAPAPAVPAQPKTISGIEYIQPPQPEYPPLSRRMGEEGKVTLRVLINEKGRPEQADVQKSSGSARLDEAARQAALRAVFKPYFEDGKALAVFALIPINFSLQ